MAMRVAVVGSYGVGLTMRVGRMPVGGETLSDGVFASGHGGKGSNQAVAAARLGAEVSFLTGVGPDAFGVAACDLWREEGRDTTPAPTAAGPKGGGDRAGASGADRIVIAPGALDQLTPADVDAFEDEIAAADILVTGFEIPVEVARRALQLARRHGVRTLLNPAPAVRLDSELWELADVVTPNRSEAAVLTGEPVETADACADAIRARFGGAIVVTLGGEGCLLDTPDGGRTRVAPVPPREVVDTTGAGDAFTGALAVALARGDKLPAAVRFASAAGAHAVATAEVIPSLARPSDIADLLG